MNNGEGFSNKTMENINNIRLHISEIVRLSDNKKFKIGEKVKIKDSNVKYCRKILGFEIYNYPDRGYVVRAILEDATVVGDKIYSLVEKII